VRPEENGASRDQRGIERTEVAAVEASGVIGQDEYLSHLQNAATLPSGHRVPIGVGSLRKAGEHATQKDLLSEPADEISCNGGYRLEQVGGPGEVAPTSGEGGDDRWQPESNQVADARRCLGDEIQSDWNALRRVPDDEQRRLLSDHRRNDQGNSDNHAQERSQLHGFSPEEDRRRASLSHVLRSVRW